MKNLDSIISQLRRSGLLPRIAGGTSESLLGPSFTRNISAKKEREQTANLKQRGPLAAISGVAWKAYQVYSQQAYARKTVPRNKYAQQAHLQNLQLQHLYAQQNLATKQHQETVVKPAGVSQSRYIASAPQHTLTYSPSSITQQQFDHVVHDESHDSGQMLVLRAMITAANADGHIDENERQRIYQKIENYDLSNEDKAGLLDELREPKTLQELVNAVPNPETAIEVYAASLFAIDEKKVASQDYLNQLACTMFIPPELVSAVHDQAEKIAND